MKLLEDLSKRETRFLILLLILTTSLIMSVWFGVTYYNHTDTLMKGQKVYLERLLELETIDENRKTWNLILDIVIDYEELTKDFWSFDFIPPVIGDK